MAHGAAFTISDPDNFSAESRGEGQRMSRNDWLRLLVTAGFLTGYAIVIARDGRSKNKTGVIANSIFLPSNLIWLWLIR